MWRGGSRSHNHNRRTQQCSVFVYDVYLRYISTCLQTHVSLVPVGVWVLIGACATLYRVRSESIDRARMRWDGPSPPPADARTLTGTPS